MASVVMLNVVVGIPETYENLKSIMEVCQLSSQTFKFKTTNDLKMDNILLGLMSNSSSYPCPYCEIFHDYEKRGPPRTLKRIRYFSTS